MAADTRTCFFCGGTLTPIVVGSYFYRHQGVMYVVKRLPAMLCGQCGEKYLSAEDGRKLNELIERKGFSGTELARVMEFQPEPESP